MHTPQSLFERLNQLGIKYVTYNHAPVFTVQDAHEILVHLPPHGPCKNLFLRDKKNRLYLVVALFDTKVVIKELAKTFSAPELRFASSEQLFDSLGVTPGSVTPFGLINDIHHSVSVILDHEMLTHEYIGIHPLINNATTLITPIDLCSFIVSCGNRIEWFNQKND